MFKNKKKSDNILYNFLKRNFWKEVIILLLLIILIFYYFNQQQLNDNIIDKESKLKEVLELNKKISEQNSKLLIVMNSVTDVVDIAFIVDDILDTTDNSTQKIFLKKSLPYTIKLQIEHDIPASAVLGMAIYESNYGSSQLAKESNNFFGMKALGDYHGKTIEMHTSDFNNSVEHVQPFRKYDSMKDGFCGFYVFLRDRDRYGNVFDKRSSGTDFIKALLSAGYCPDSKYLTEVTNIINKHKLFLLEKILKEKKKNIRDNTFYEKIFLDNLLYTGNEKEK
jgi:flagellum-specific peptidoglycan hydrolase FlgJ